MGLKASLSKPFARAAMVELRTKSAQPANAQLKQLNEIQKSVQLPKAIDDDLDLTSINLLKQLQRKHPDNVQIRTIKPCSSLESFNTNLFDCKLEELNKSINTCFID